ncbi:MAG TPA: DUF2857 family protein [Chromatiales bacterium]|nr:DUF2857 family protein [Chromatiales bacterium]
MNHHADLVESVIRYCLRAAQHGHWHELRDIGLGEDEIRMMLGMSVQHLMALEHRIGRDGHPVRVRVDRAAFRRLLEDAAQAWHADPIRVRLLELDAPQPLMQHLLGTGCREYTQMRTALGLASSVGRPPEPDEDTIDRISQAWDEAGHDDPGALHAEDWIRLAETTGADLRTIWRQVRRWYGKIEAVARSQGSARNGTDDRVGPQVARLRRAGRQS